MSSNIAMPFEAGGAGRLPHTPQVLPDASDTLSQAAVLEHWYARAVHVAKAVGALVHSFPLELRREYVPVKGNPHGADEHVSRLVLRAKIPGKTVGMWHNRQE